MTKGREQAWRVAVVLTDAGVPPVPAYARWVLRTTAVGGAAFVLGPRLDPAVMATLRAVETESLDLARVLARVEERIDAEP